MHCFHIEGGFELFVKFEIVLFPRRRDLCTFLQLWRLFWMWFHIWMLFSKREGNFMLLLVFRLVKSIFVAKEIQFWTNCHLSVSFSLKRIVVLKVISHEFFIAKGRLDYCLSYNQFGVISHLNKYFCCGN